jgi:hypothetical protein
MLNTASAPSPSARFLRRDHAHPAPQHLPSIEPCLLLARLMPSSPAAPKDHQLLEHKTTQASIFAHFIALSLPVLKRLSFERRSSLRPRHATSFVGDGSPRPASPEGVTELGYPSNLRPCSVALPTRPLLTPKSLRRTSEFFARGN